MLVSIQCTRAIVLSVLNHCADNNNKTMDNHMCTHTHTITNIVRLIESKTSSFENICTRFIHLMFPPFSTSKYKDKQSLFIYYFVVPNAYVEIVSKKRKGYAGNRNLFRIRFLLMFFGGLLPKRTATNTNFNVKSENSDEIPILRCLSDAIGA